MYHRCSKVVRLWSWGRTCVVEWLPQTATFCTAVKKTPALLASWNLARFSSRRVSAWKFSLGMDGALAAQMRALVLHGLPTTTTFTDFLATCTDMSFQLSAAGNLQTLTDQCRSRDGRELLFILDYQTHPSWRSHAKRLHHRDGNLQLRIANKGAARYVKPRGQVQMHIVAVI